VRIRHENRPAVITDAPENQDDEFDRRRRRYAIMMSVRALCVIAAALTYLVSWILAVALVVGGAILPWCAVILANDRPPKKTRRRGHYYGRPNGKKLESRQKALPGSRDDRTIDG
jgi:Flp pilus assembly protein TadB